MLKKLGFIVFLALLAGCSATGKQFGGLEKPDSTTVQVYIYRPAAFVQSGIFPDIELDSKLEGKLKNGGFIAFRASPGDHKLAVAGNYLQWNYLPRTFDVSFEAGKTYFFRLQPFISGGSTINGVYLANHGYSFMRVEDQDAAVAELAKLKESQ